LKDKTNSLNSNTLTKFFQSENEKIQSISPIKKIQQKFNENMTNAKTNLNSPLFTNKIKTNLNEVDLNKLIKTGMDYNANSNSNSNNNLPHIKSNLNLQPPGTK
jgi:hypothetical protein